MHPYLSYSWEYSGTTETLVEEVWGGGVCSVYVDAHVRRTPGRTMDAIFISPLNLSCRERTNHLKLDIKLMENSVALERDGVRSEKEKG